MNNSLVQNRQNAVQQHDKPKFGAYITQKGVQSLIQSTVGKNATRFTASIVSAVSNNPALQDCDHSTILSAALLGESLNLSPSPQLGQFYMVPFDDRKNGRKVAQFQIGYKGYVQLAIRSGYYKKINVLPIKAGELVKFDPLEEDITVNLIQDDDEREAAQTIGYYAMLEYMNGFRKAIYWSAEKMLSHADKYSQAFSKDGGEIKTKNGMRRKVSYHDFLDGKYDERDDWMYSSYWYKDFDGMAMKTMLRQLISKWGIMSIEMQEAYTHDEAVIGENGEISFVEYDRQEIPQEEHIEVVADNATAAATADEQENFDFFATDGGQS